MRYPSSVLPQHSRISVSVVGQSMWERKGKTRYSHYRHTDATWNKITVADSEPSEGKGEFDVVKEGKAQSPPRAPVRRGKHANGDKD